MGIEWKQGVIAALMLIYGVGTIFRINLLTTLAIVCVLLAGWCIGLNALYRLFKAGYAVRGMVLLMAVIGLSGYAAFLYQPPLLTQIVYWVVASVLSVPFVAGALARLWLSYHAAKTSEKRGSAASLLTGGKTIQPAE